MVIVDSKTGTEYSFRHGQGDELTASKHGDIKNCTVAFVNKHLSMDKCKQACQALGAKHFRWFDEGCCECIGEYCLNYGVSKPECDTKWEFY